MTRKTISLVLEVEDRAGPDSVAWAKDLLRESGQLDGAILVAAWWGVSRGVEDWLRLGRDLGMIPPDLSGEVDRAGDLLMTAWAIIANAQNVPVDQLAESPNWGKERRAWAQAAVGFREEFHAWLADHPGPVAPEVSALVCGAVSAAGTVCHEVGFHKDHEGRFPAVVEVHDPAAGDVQAKRVRLVERWPA